MKRRIYHLKKIVFALVLCLTLPAMAISDSIVGNWNFVPEGSLYRMRFYFKYYEGGALDEAFFPAIDVFEKDPEALRGGKSAESTTLSEVNFIDDDFVTLRYRDGNVVRGLYTLFLFYDAVATGFTYDELKIWKLSIIDSEKTELVFFLRQKSDTGTIQMTYQHQPYIIFGTLVNVDGKTISLDSYGPEN